MKMKLVSIGLVVSAILMLMMWLSAQHRQDSVARMIATQAQTSAAPVIEPVTASPPALPGAPAAPGAAVAAVPDARASQSRLAFERQARAFLQDAPQLDDATRLARARALSQDIERREQNRELSSDEALMMRIGLIQVAVEDPRQRVAQVQEVLDRHTARTAARQQAALAQQRRDAQLREYKAQEARIVTEVLAMRSYPDGLSRDDYLRQRLQAARDAINYGQSPAPAPTQ